MMNETLAQSLAEMNRQLLGLLDATLAVIDPQKLAAPYDRWWAASRELLAEGAAEVAHTHGMSLDQRWRTWDVAKEAWLATPDLQPQTLLVEACLRALPEVLSGRQSAHEILFPDGSMERVAGIHCGNAITDHFNQILSERVAAYLCGRTAADPSAVIRILEVGAGIGGTTEWLLKCLTPFRERIQEYGFTDVSQAFLHRARERFTVDHPYLTTRILDIETSPVAQGLMPDRYDLVIAANVLHVASDIRHALRNLKALLHRHGLLFINELSARSLFTHLTFGLLDVWWSYRDAPLRIPGCPGLHPESWERVLREEGFPQVRFPAKHDHGRGQQIIIAESDGIVRQRCSIGAREAVATASAGTATVTDIDADALRAPCTALVKKVIAATLKLPEGRIDPAKPLSKYGLDSILAIQLTKAMREHFDGVRTTLFFEADTVNALVDHLLESHRGVLQQRFSETVTLQPPVPSGERLATGKDDEAAPIFTASAGDIAIIGLAGRYPDAPDLERFWKNLMAGHDAVTEAPESRWHHRRHGGAEFSGGRQWGGFLDHVEWFDPLFFDISPREAEIMAPEERLFLETVWNLLEVTGHTRERIRERYDRRVGVYVGAMYQHYREVASDPAHHALASIASFSAIANRVSHFFDFHGPSIAVDTMCSASTIAIHLACESLRQGECGLAIAGGVNLSLHPNKFIGLRQAQLIGSHPDSRSFACGDGYLPAEAVGAVLLKPLSQAIEAGDTVLAVIKSSATNHDGHTAGMAIPNLKAQQRLIAEHFRRSGIDPRTIGYVEAAANGSALGDPIEISALAGAFRQFTPDRRFCAIGSVKSNIGHPEAASGIAQLTKVVLQLRHRRLAPSIKAWPLNPEIDLDESPFRLLRESQIWEPMIDLDGRRWPRRATVSSFGGGGSNAHLIIEEYAGTEREETGAVGPWPMVLSARTEAALRAMAGHLRDALERDPTLSPERVAYTLQCGREAMEERLGLIVDSLAQLRQGLDEFLTGVSGRTLRFRGLADLNAPESMAEGGDCAALLERWVRGERVDWHRSYRPAKGLLSIVELPTYPFQRERCWLTSADEAAMACLGDFATTRYERTFTFSGAEPFLRDHHGGLPAVLHLELARIAAGQRIAAFHQVVWTQPAVVVDGALSLCVRLRETAGGLRFETTDARGERFCHGEIVVRGESSAARPAPLAFDQIRAHAPAVASRETCDRVLQHSNGPSLLTMESLHYGPTDALARIKRSTIVMSSGVPDGRDAATLDAGLLNGAVLTSIVWSQLREPGRPLPMPFALEALHLYGDLPDEAYVHVQERLAAGTTTVRRFDMMLADLDGQVLLVFKGFSAFPPSPGLGEVSAQWSLREELTGMLCAIQKIRRDQVDPRATWSRYGLASIGFTEFTERLNRRYGLALMPTVFFEYPTLDALERFIAETLGTGPRRDDGSVLSTSPHNGTMTGDDSAMSIAIVGVSARLPGAETLDELWAHLVNNRDLITEVPRERWDWRTYFGDPHQELGKTRAKWGGFLAAIDCFDPRFFGLSPRDAEGMDPQSRLVLECAWAAVEDAGYAASRWAGRSVGVFIGVSTADYKDLCREAAPDLAAQVKPFLIANRVSYHLDLRGPSEVIDTACSSSLVALHRAVESIRRGSCEAALVGGVNVIASPEITCSLGRSGVLSEDGRCMAFDRRANGMVRGEGVAVVLLKPLSAAVQAGDRIYGVVRGSAENHDGRSSSAAAPNPAAQRDLIVRAMGDAGVDPRTLGYIEAHGTGTELGDPIEIRGLCSAFETLYRQRSLAAPERPYCGVGSVKTNIGHLEAAAGIAGLIKVLLMFAHGGMPGNVHLREPNPYLELAGSPFYLVRESAAWPRMNDDQGRPLPRRAGLSSFGIGGANAHLVLEEYLDHRRTSGPAMSTEPVLIPLSASDEAGLRRVVSTLRGFVAGRPTLALADVAYTLQIGREAMAVRLGFTVSSTAELLDILSELEGRAGELAGLQLIGVPGAAGHELLERWVRGEMVDWESRYVAARPLRITLPTYPFAKERYWVPKPIAADSRISVQTPLLSGGRLGDGQGWQAVDDAEAKDAASQRRILCRPVWRAAPFSADAPAHPYTERLTLFCGNSYPGSETSSLYSGEVHLTANAEGAAARYEAIATAAFEQIRALLERRPKGEALVQIVMTSGGEEGLFAGLAGLLRTAAQENSRIRGQLLEVEPGMPEGLLRRWLSENAASPDDGHFRYRAGQRERLGWEELPTAEEGLSVPWRNHGVYLITGGSGGLGLIFAREIVAHRPGVTVVLAGRSRLNPDAEAQLHELESLGGHVDYRQIDVSQRREVDALVADIIQRWGVLHGILHCAGVNRGRYILKKSSAEFRSVLAPKVSGADHLDQATRAMGLDLFILFSSGAGAVGHPGQADYAAANGFLDQFAACRAERVAAGERSGQTLAINWPLWQEGGMRVDRASAEALRERTGMTAMATQNGIAAFYEALASHLPQVAVVAGDPVPIRRALFPPAVDAETMNPRREEAPVAAPGNSMNALRQPTLRRLAALLADQVKLPEAEIEADEPLERYGIDSIAILHLNERLELVFGPVSKTLLFEFRTLRELAEYFVADYPEECAAWTGAGTAFEEPASVGKGPDRESSAVPKMGTSQALVDDDPIAIIGMAGRFPQAANLEEFWENLKRGRDSISELPADRWPLVGFFNEEPERAVAEGMSYSKWGGFLDGVADFDPLFFNISPREALVMDPQERLFLQTAWAAVEDAGYCRQSLKRQVGGRVGVFAGITKTGFDLYGPDLWRRGERIYPHTSFGSVANRVSYILDLNGPSMPIDTLCSSSLTALHEACAHIRRGECEMALAGGVNVYLHPSSYTSLCTYGFLAHSHRCKSFGQGGDGFVPGEGVGVVVLKRLSQAIRDRDPIHALIRGTSINHDGKTNGYTVPNPCAQAELVRTALDAAGVHARGVSYIEAHGTGTELGDPIEVAGLTQAFRRDTPDCGFAALGSVKSNIGHLEAAAGIAGLMKIVLQMRHGQLAPSLHAQELNPHIGFARTPFFVQRQLDEWRRPVIEIDGVRREFPRIAGLSSFGAGGSNAHAVIEEYVPPLPTARSGTGAPVAILLSARDEERLREAAHNLLHYVEKQSFMLEDLAYTLQVGREALACRLGFLADSREALVTQLRTVVTGNQEEGIRRGRAKGERGSLAGLLGEEQAAAVVEGWMSEGRLDKLLEQWVTGLAVDWDRLHREPKPYRINLPTYPFARERYWLDVAATLPSHGVAGSAALSELPFVPSKGEERHELLYFQEVWEAASRPSPGMAVESLLCCLAEHYDPVLVERVLVAHGLREIACFVGDPELNAGAIQGYLQRLGRIDRVLYLGTGREEEAAWIASLLRMVSDAGTVPHKLVLAGEYRDAVQRSHLESWIGFERSLRLSRPDTRIATLIASASDDPADWIETVWAELSVERAGAVLYQGGERWEPRIQPLLLANRQPSVAGNILITGGCGGLGRLFAGHLAKRAGVNLILTGRSAVDEERRGRLQELEALGAGVLYLQADVGDAAAMAAGLAEVRRRFGAIHGVIHAAGIEASGSVFDNDRQTFRAVVEPKVAGALLLDRLLAAEPLRFVCYFSSSSAILGDFGSCDYAVGNRFLMAYGEARNRVGAAGGRSGQCIVINWPLWREGRMGQGASTAIDFYLKSSGQRMLERAEGFDLFDRLLAGDGGHCLVLAGKPSVVHRFLGMTGEIAGQRESRRVDRAPRIEWQVEDVLKRIAGGLLAIPPERLEGERNLADFGFDSITLAEYAKALSARFGLDIAPALFYGHPTIDDLTAYLVAEHGEAMRSLFVVEAAPEEVAGTHGNGNTASSASPVQVLDKRLAVDEPMAIIGMSGRFPQTGSVAAFWQKVRQGESGIAVIPENRRDGAADPTERGGFIDGIDHFDPLFFEIPPSEADAMDPRQRLFLEVAWEALEDAGAMGERIRGTSCGVYVGVEEGLADPLAGAINSHQNATLAARIAYLLDLEGPNLALTSACSSALVALHQACLALRQGDCEMALVGGVNLILTTAGFAGLRQAGMLSADGECRVFDQRASGLVPGEAVVAVLLKPLSAALRDGDPVHACIKASSVNHNGRTNGIAAPNPVRQAALIERLYRQAGWNPTDLQLVMAHSIGSPMGDPIEIEALSQAFSRLTHRRGFCAISTVKPLVGHTFAASGLVSLIATVMAMKEGVMPGLRHCGLLNELIHPEQTPFIFARENQPWPRPAHTPRRAAVGATGISGTNVHVLLEEFVDAAPTVLSAAGGPWIFPFSAQMPERLREVVQRMVAHLATDRESPLGDIAYTLEVGREALKQRLAVIATSREELATRLAAFLSGTEVDPWIFIGHAGGGRRDRVSTSTEVEQALKSQDLPRLAALWSAGALIPWARLHTGRHPRIVELPTYPFARRVCQPVSGSAGRPVEPSDEKRRQAAMQENTVAKLYRTIAELERPEFKEGFLTFFPLLEKRPGFSITRIGLHPEAHPEEVALIREKQRESRSVLLAGVDFGRIDSVIDVGCGYGADIIELAARYPHLEAHGYTITPAQARVANERIERGKLGSRVTVFNRDSTLDHFPGRYDLALGIEVCCHIADKDALFRNVVGALKEGGRVLLMDFVAYLRGAIIDANISVYIPTSAQWVALISAHGLAIDEIVDLSAQIANAMDDPECEANTRQLPPVLRDSWRNWTNNAVAMERGWVGYRLFKLRRAEGLTGAALREYNQGRFDRPTPYPEALAAMLAGNSEAVSVACAGFREAASHRAKPDWAPIRTRLDGVFRKVLRLSAAELAAVETFQELGLSSLNAVALLEAINSEFDLDLPTSVVFEFGTLDDLARYIGIRIAPGSASAAGAATSNSESAPAPSVLLSTRAMPKASTGSLKPESRPAVAEGIAIVGLSCRCAGAADVDDLWRLVSEGRDALSEISDRAWLDYFQRHSERTVPLRYGAMAEIDRFDPLFFRISPKEADAMGIVQRLLLEESYRALESVGHAPASLRGRLVGTYIGLGAGVGPEEPDHSHLAMLGVDTSIAAARIAFLLDLQGPALAVNTACSSSLVAVDLAVKALQNGDVDLAIAGGITIWDHPAPFIPMNNAGMLSPTGECRPFDADANGIIVGDGVGMVVLKRLADAERDGDAIHAVIRGSGTNQDGQTSGITVPSFLAQSRLQASVYARAGIRPAEIQYIEAHGTATKLGDPVEIHALTDSFAGFTPEKGFCAIGSLKANIGHTAAAAGVLGLIKTVCALEHRQLPPSIHFVRENEHIDFANSPVYVNTALKEWPLNASGGRMAAVSAFGYSGTNAHLVLEEYRRDEANEGEETRPGAGNGGVTVHSPRPLAGEGLGVRVADSTTNPRTLTLSPSPLAGGEGTERLHGGLIVLSARDRERLMEAAGNLHRFLKERRGKVDLAAIAYTLQVGRDSMEQRVAFQVDNDDELLDRLAAFAAGNEAIERCWRGYHNSQDSQLGLLLDDEDARELIVRWLAKGKLAKLAELWVAGYRLDWEALYGVSRPRRIRLPGYPFARRVCRVPAIGLERAGASSLHPLIHRNTSGLVGVRFSSRFSGREFFLTDHQVQGVKMLPGVAYLEMARAALEQAGKGHGVSLRNVVWARPMVVAEEGLEVHTTLTPDDHGRIRFEIHTGGGDQPTVVHGRGSARFGPAAAVAPLDLATLQQRTAAERFSAERCYRAFAEVGVHYGAAHRAIDEVWVGSSQALARLTLPAAVATGAGRFLLHPSLLDGALQATVGLVLADIARPEVGRQPMLPFALEELQILGGCPASVWAWIRPADGPGSRDSAGRKLDIDLCDDRGTVWVRMKGLVSRTLDGAVARDSEGQETLICHPVWERCALAEGAGEIAYARRLLLSFGLEGLSVEALSWLRPALEYVPPDSAAGDIAERFQHQAVALFARLRSLFEVGGKGAILVQVAIPASGEERLSAALTGLLKTAHRERPGFHGQLIQVDPHEPVEQVLAWLDQNACAPEDEHICYLGGVRHVIRWRESSQSELQLLPWRNDGVYLITGGAGGLGLIFAAEIAEQTERCTLVLVGRSTLDEAQQHRLAALENQGAQVEYHRVDVADREAVAERVRATRERYGALNGILHAAGVIRDGVILNKSREVFATVLRPKVAGTVNLDLATAELDLDLFVLFSSGAGAWGNPGQADYATANAFMDSFAEWRNERLVVGERCGRTLAVNWPLWKAGGMRVNRRTEERMKETLGAIPLDTSAGLQAFYRGLASGLPRIAVMQGDAARLRAAGFGAADGHVEPQPVASAKVNRAEPPAESIPELRPESKPRPESSPAPVSAETHFSSPARLRTWVSDYLARLVCATLGVKATELDDHKDLAAYGLDSIMVLDINNHLEKHFPDLPQTLFFEYSTLRSLVDYFMESHAATLQRLAATDSVALAPDAVAAGVSGAGAEPAAVPPAPRVLEQAGASVAETPFSLDELIERMELDVTPAGVPSGKTVLADLMAARRAHSPFHSFAPFAEPLAGFSLSRSLVTPERCRAELRVVVEKQAELRQVLFYKEPLEQITRVLDLGCGIGADLIELATAYPHLIAHGLTLSKEDARVAETMIRDRGLGARVRIFREDNTAHRYAPGYGLIFSIQTLHFITDYSAKQTLFGKLSTALRDDGRMVMAEYVCALAEPMRDATLKVTVHTRNEWARLLADNGLLLSEVIDLSGEVINFLRDPHLEAVVKGLDAEQEREVRKLGQQITALERGWVHFCLLKMTKAGGRKAAEVTALNAAKLATRRAYADARREMREGPGMAAYDAVLERFPEFLRAGGVSP